LTEPRDKLPALSGVAAWIFGGSSDDYLAGLLRYALHDGLAWYIVSRKIGHKSTETYRAPSWSWASTDHDVKFIAAEPPVAQRSGAWRRQQRVEPFAAMSAQHQIRIHSSYTTIRGCNPFGEVDAGAIKLKGKVRAGTISRDTERVFRVQDPRTGIKIAFFYPDDENRWLLLPKIRANPQEDWSPQSDIIANIECLCIDYWVDTDGWAALAIEPLSSEDRPRSTKRMIWQRGYEAYRRVGLLKYAGSGFKWFQDSSWRRIELF
jgi:hypothetical protein